MCLNPSESPALKDSEITSLPAFFPLPGLGEFLSGPGEFGIQTMLSASDSGLIPGWGRSLGMGNGSPLQYPCLENPTDRGAWWATVQGVIKSGTRPSG